MTNTIIYGYDQKESKVVAIKIDFAEPDKLEALARVAKIHVPIVEAMRKDPISLSDFESFELDLPNLPVVLKVVNVSECDQ